MICDQTDAPPSSHEIMGGKWNIFQSLESILPALIIISFLLCSVQVWRNNAKQWPQLFITPRKVKGHLQTTIFQGKNIWSALDLSEIGCPKGFSPKQSPQASVSRPKVKGHLSTGRWRELHEVWSKKIWPDQTHQTTSNTITSSVAVLKIYFSEKMRQYWIQSSRFWFSSCLLSKLWVWFWSYFSLCLSSL